MEPNKITETIIGAAIELHLLTYLKLSGSKVVLLIDFNVPTLKNGIKSMVI
jgi:hypothetical protein